MGKGPENAITSAGISAHNSFIATHLAYGGTAAYIYLLWLIWLAIGIFKMLMKGNLAVENKIMIITFFWMMLFSNIFSNKGFTFLSSVYAVALIEKYTMYFRVALSDRIFHKQNYIVERIKT